MPSYGQDYYRILQVHPEAEPEVIQAAYRRLARMHHPDTSSASGTQMKLLNEAYEVLSDARQRTDYDRWYRLNAFRSPSRTGAPFRTSAPPPSASSAPQPAPARGALLRPVLLSLGLMLLFSFLAFDLFRLGIRGLPEITLLLLALGWVIYRFGGFRDIWRG